MPTYLNDNENLGSNKKVAPIYHLKNISKTTALLQGVWDQMNGAKKTHKILDSPLSWRKGGIRFQDAFPDAMLNHNLHGYRLTRDICVSEMEYSKTQFISFVKWIRDSSFVRNNYKAHRILAAVTLEAQHM